MRHDPLANPEEAIERVYAYAAYRLGAGADAEDATSDTIERALRYRSTYDRRKGLPLAWMLGIARRCVDATFAARAATADGAPEPAAPGDVAEEAVARLDLVQALARLGARDRDLIALRYGAGLSPREIGDILNAKRNAVDVALHRARAKLKSELERGDAGTDVRHEPVEVAPDPR